MHTHHMNNATTTTASDLFTTYGWTGVRGGFSLTQECGGLMVGPLRGPRHALADVLPAGLTLVLGDESGVVEYHPTTPGYMRLAGMPEYDSAASFLGMLADAIS